MEAWRAGDFRALSRDVTVRRPVELAVTPGDPRARGAGLTFGVLGIPTLVGGVLIYGGTGAIAWGCSYSDGDRVHPCPSDAVVKVAATTGAAIALGARDDDHGLADVRREPPTAGARLSLGA